MNTAIFSILMGGAVLVYTAACGLRYRQEIAARKDGGKIWGLCGIMGLAMTLAGEGNGLFLSLQALLGLVTALCCLLQLHRERLVRRRIRARRKSSVAEKPLQKARPLPVAGCGCGWTVRQGESGFFAA